MRSIPCSFCGVRFDAPAAVCPHCGGPLAEAGLDRTVPSPSDPANDDALDLPEVDGAMVVVPVGVDDATLFAPPAPPAKPRPPPLPKKKRALA
ncbi:MAG: FmdB family zinc ribbon protein [Myxococcales bacterium]